MVNPVSASTQSAYMRQGSLEDRMVRGDANAHSSGARIDSPSDAARPGSSGQVSTANAASVNHECESCKNRKYQDVSTDPGVSFKTATRVAPQASSAAVASHEGEHVSRERAKAGTEGREVVYQSVRYSSATCPECGKVYTSGGETTTVTRAVPKRPEAGVGESLDAYA